MVIVLIHSGTNKNLNFGSLGRMFELFALFSISLEFLRQLDK